MSRQGEVRILSYPEGERVVIEALREQVAAYDAGRVGDPPAVARWLRSLADKLDSLERRYR